MTIPTRKRAHQLSSGPDGYLPAGYVVPIHLTVKQTVYCRHAIGVAPFIYNLYVATHRFCRVNRLPWSSWQDLNKEFNAIKRDQFPFVTKVSCRIAKGAIRGFGAAVANWRDTSQSSRRRARHPLQQQASHQTALPQLGQARPHAAQGHHPRSPHRVQERTVAALRQLY